MSFAEPGPEMDVIKPQLGRGHRSRCMSVSRSLLPILEALGEETELNPVWRPRRLATSSSTRTSAFPWVCRNDNEFLEIPVSSTRAGRSDGAFAVRRLPVARCFAGRAVITGKVQLSNQVDPDPHGIPIIRGGEFTVNLS